MGNNNSSSRGWKKSACTLKKSYPRLHNLPYYRKKLEERKINPYDIKSLSCLSHLPFTTKEDLRQAYPFGAIAEPLRNVVRVHSSSGTTGTATVVGYTKKDIESWAELAARALSSYGVDEEDIIQVSFGYGLFTGGLGIHYGAEKLGATVVPASAGNTLRQIQIMKDLKITVLACTPSYALYLAEVARENNINWKESSLRIGVFGAEPWSEEMREDIEKKLPIRAFDIYGLSEVIGPGVAFECEEREGLHISEDHFLPENNRPPNEEFFPPGKKESWYLLPLPRKEPQVRYRHWRYLFSQLRALFLWKNTGKNEKSFLSHR